MRSTRHRFQGKQIAYFSTTYPVLELSILFLSSLRLDRTTIHIPFYRATDISIGATVTVIITEKLQLLESVIQLKSNRFLILWLETYISRKLFSKLTALSGYLRKEATIISIVLPFVYHGFSHFTVH